VYDYPTLQKMHAMAGDLLRDEYPAPAARFLLWRVLATEGPFSVPTGDRNTDAYRYLAFIGALRFANGDNDMRLWAPGDAAPRLWVLSSPMVRTVLTTNVLPRVRRPLPRDPLPWTADDRLDMLAVQRVGLRYLNRGYLRTLRVDRVGAKRCMVAPYIGKPVWREFPLHLDFYAVLRAWLPSVVAIYPEGVAPSASGGRKHVDLVLTVKGHTYLLDFMSCATSADAATHAANMDEYASHFRAREAWLCNVTVGCDEPLPLVDASERRCAYGLRVLHAVVDLEYTRAAFVVQDVAAGTLQLLLSDGSARPVAATDTDAIKAGMVWPVGEDALDATVVRPIPPLVRTAAAAASADAM
jgi:hypothetical protein